jgi:hypothetical protein
VAAVAHVVEEAKEHIMSRTLLMTCLSAAAAFVPAGNGLAADAAQLEANKKTVVAFYEAAINRKDFEAASAYLGSRYTQHNPGAALVRMAPERMLRDHNLNLTPRMRR